MATKTIPPLHLRVERLKKRRLLVVPQVADKRKAQVPPKLEFLLHECFNQRAGEHKQPCNCARRVDRVCRDRMLRRGWADFLIITRCGKRQQNRKILVLTPAGIAHFKKAEEALIPGRAVSITAFEEYHIAPSCLMSGMDREIQAVYMQGIKKVSHDVKAHRDHHVHPKGNGPDPDEFFDEDDAMSNGAPMIYSGPDRNYAQYITRTEDPYRDSDRRVNPSDLFDSLDEEDHEEAV